MILDLTEGFGKLGLEICQARNTLEVDTSG